jgi:hypothetical protein
MIFIFFKVSNLKYWHPYLPFGQHISVSTLVVKEKKIRKSKGTTKNRKFRCVYIVNELISQIIWRTNFSCWLLVLFSVLFVNCGDNIRVTHEIPLRVKLKTRRTQCTIRSAVNHLQNLFNVKTDCRFHTLHTRVPTQKFNEIFVYLY